MLPAVAAGLPYSRTLVRPIGTVLCSVGLSRVTIGPRGPLVLRPVRWGEGAEFCCAPTPGLVPPPFRGPGLSTSVMPRFGLKSGIQQRERSVCQDSGGLDNHSRGQGAGGR